MDEKMRFDVAEVGGIGEFEVEERLEGEGAAKELIYKVPEGKAFLVVRMSGGEEAKTVEVRTDGNLGKLLREKYESVMESRYFGRGGIEVVLSGQMELREIYDLVRLSYNLTST